MLISIDFARTNPDTMRRLFVVATSIVVIFWFFGGILLVLNAIAFIRPLNQMERATEAIAGENLDMRLIVHSDDQLGKLEQAMNQMATEIKEKRLIKTLQQ